MGVSWHLPGRIIYDCPQGVITPEIAKASSNAIIELLDSQPVPPSGGIHLILDMRQATEIPRNLSNASHALKYMRHPALGWTVMITESQIQRMFASVLAQVFRVRFKVVADMAEAVDFLTRYDPALAQGEQHIASSD